MRALRRVVMVAAAAMAGAGCGDGRDDESSFGSSAAAAVIAPPTRAIAPAAAEVLPTPLSNLPAAVKETDFRVHPPRVKQAVARPASDGSAIVEVTLAPDKRLGTSLVVQGADGSIR
ncbi:MAG TPA: hypothetical protein VMU50_12575, partial [Polyangia bacterium]|nr:hypothetical protein [Polyangia bacterium]